MWISVNMDYRINMKFTFVSTFNDTYKNLAVSLEKILSQPNMPTGSVTEWLEMVTHVHVTQRG